MAATNSKVIDAAARLGVAVSRRPIDEARPRVGSFIALTAPDGKRFANGPMELLCDDWDDAWQRIERASLVLDENA
jgi:hypothetical protein